MQDILPNILYWYQFIYGKKQSVIVGKLFFSYRSVWTSTESSRFQNKWFELLLWDTSLEKKHWIICQDRVFASFLFVLSLLSVLGSHLYCNNSSLGRNTHTWEVKLPLFSHIPNMFAVGILSKTGGMPNLIVIYKNCF